MSSFAYEIIVVDLSIVAKTTNVIVAIVASISFVANEFENLNLECEFDF